MRNVCKHEVIAASPVLYDFGLRAERMCKERKSIKCTCNTCSRVQFNAGGGRGALSAIAFHHFSKQNPRAEDAEGRQTADSKARARVCCEKMKEECVDFDKECNILFSHLFARVGLGGGLCVLRGVGRMWKEQTRIRKYWCFTFF